MVSGRFQAFKSAWSGCWSGFSYDSGSLKECFRRLQERFRESLGSVQSVSEGFEWRFKVLQGVLWAFQKLTMGFHNVSIGSRSVSRVFMGISEALEVLEQVNMNGFQGASKNDLEIFRRFQSVWTGLEGFWERFRSSVKDPTRTSWTALSNFLAFLQSAEQLRIRASYWLTHIFFQETVEERSRSPAMVW